MPSVGACSSSPSVTSQRQNRRMPRSRVLMVDGSHVSASPASQRLMYRTLWLYSSMVRGALAAAPRCRRKDTSRSSRQAATAAGYRASHAVLPLRVPRTHSFSLGERLARLGWTRIGSPGIFGVRTTKALFRGLKPQGAGERKPEGYRVSFTALRSARNGPPSLPTTGARYRTAKTLRDDLRRHLRGGFTARPSTGRR
jgi:hypothetical protein